MNPRQRRGALLIALAAIGAIGVFVSISSYLSDVRSQVSPSGTVVQLVEDVPAFTPVTAGQVEEVSIPERWIPDGAVRSSGELGEQVAANDLVAGSLLQSGMLREPSPIEDERRELAILVDAETGVAGKLRPGDHVDVFATFPQGDGAEGDDPPVAEIVIADAEVIDVGEEFIAPEEESAATAGLGVGGSAVPVTFSLPVEDSLVLTYAESFATNVRLGLRGSGSTHEVAAEDRVYRRFERPEEPGLGPVEDALAGALADLEAAVRDAVEEEEEAQQAQEDAEEESAEEGDEEGLVPDIDLGDEDEEEGS